MIINVSDAMEENIFWKINTSSIGVEIPCTLWNPNEYYAVYNSFLPIRILRKRNRVLNISLHFFTTYFNIIILVVYSYSLIILKVLNTGQRFQQSVGC